MTTSATPTAAITVTTVRAAEVTRLEAVVAAGPDALAAASAAAGVAAAALDASETSIAALRQEASVLRQRLAAAQTGPERHTIELALNANRIGQVHAGLDRLTANQAKGRADRAVTRTAAAVQVAGGRLPEARRQLAAATADADADAELLTDLATGYPAAVAQIQSLAAPVDEAVTRLRVLLGGAHLVDRVVAAIGAARQAEDQLIAAAAAARAGVLAAGTRAGPVDGAVAEAGDALLRARAAVAYGVAAPDRVAAAVPVIEAVRTTVPPPEQPATDAAAKAVADGVPGAYDQWLVTLADDRIDAAVGLLDAITELNRVQAGDPAALRQRLIDADHLLAGALSGQLAQRLKEDDAAAAADSAGAAVDAAASPAERHRAAFLRGE